LSANNQNKGKPERKESWDARKALINMKAGTTGIAMTGMIPVSIFRRNDVPCTIR
jgi:hypothetical protein